jgi:hypothetical protein
MTGRVSGLTTRFQEVCQKGFVCVWCGLHQLDLILHATFKALMHSKFYCIFT